MQRILKFCLILSCLGMFTLSLSACGKKASPKPVGPADKITYPRSYPSPN